LSVVKEGFLVQTEKPAQSKTSWCDLYFPCPLSEHGIVRGPASDQNDCKSALYVISLKKNKTPTGPDQTIGVGSWNKSISKQPNGNVGRYDLPPRKDLSLATCLPKEFLSNDLWINGVKRRLFRRLPFLLKTIKKKKKIQTKAELRVKHVFLNNYFVWEFIFKKFRFEYF
jgi:hypothetical protein